MRTVFRNSEIEGRIHALQPFLSVGKLPDGTRVWSGHSGPAVSMGHLPARLHASARSAVYVVYSYDTPIAWVTESDDPRAREPYVYHVPNVGYSPTTGQHQYAVLTAWTEARWRCQVANRWGLDGRREVVRLPATAEAYGTPRRPRSGGIDGVRPGDVVGNPINGSPRAVGDDWTDDRRASAYAAMGEDASHWSPLSQEWPDMRDKVDRPGYTHPAHP